MRLRSRGGGGSRKEFSFWVMVVIATLVIWSLVKNLRAMSGLGERLAMAERDVEILAQKNQELNEAAATVGSSEFDDRYIREKLGLVQQGEAVVMIPEGLVEEYLRETVEEDVLPDEEKENWEKWLGLFFDF